MNITEARDRLLELSKLPRSWDSYDSCPVFATALLVADRILDTLQPLREVDFIAPISGGGLQLEYRWQISSSNVYLEVEVLPQGEIFYSVYVNREPTTLDQATTIEALLEEVSMYP